jgi:hypothetical protein
MAQIDPSIALQFKQPQFQDPINQFAKAQELNVNALKMNEMQRGLESQNKLRQLFSQGVDVSTPEGFKQLAAVDPATAMKLRTDALQGRKLEGDIKKTGVETDLKQLEVQREQFGNLVFNPSDANITAHIEDSVLQGKIPPAQAQSLLQQVMPLNTAQRKQFFTDMAVKAETRFQGDITKRGQDISAATQRRGQDLTDLRARETQQMQFDPQLQSTIAQAKEYGQTLGKNRALAEAALPGAVQTADESIRLIDEMVGKAPVRDKSGKVIEKGTAPHPGFASYVGATVLPGQRFIEGSPTASFEIRQKQIEGKAFLEAFNALKGGGSITEKEGEKGTQAIMRMNKASSEREYVAAARELQDIMRKGVERAKTKAGGGASAAPSGGGNVIDFNSLN